MLAVWAYRSTGRRLQATSGQLKLNCTHEKEPAHTFSFGANLQMSRSRRHADFTGAGHPIKQLASFLVVCIPQSAFELALNSGMVRPFAARSHEPALRMRICHDSASPAMRVEQRRLAMSDRDASGARPPFRRRARLIWNFYTQQQQLVVSSKAPGSIYVTEDFDGARVDEVLRARFPPVTLTQQGQKAFFKALFTQGRVSIDGHIVKASKKVPAGTSIRVSPKKFDVVAEPIEVPVLFEDDSILAVSKLAGMVMFPGPGRKSGTLCNAIAHYVKQQAVRKDGNLASLTGSAGNSLRLGFAHRLDQNTTGVMILGKTVSAQHDLIQIFNERKVEKLYLTVLAGPIKERETVNKPIGPYRGALGKYGIVPERQGGQLAITVFHRLATNGKWSLVIARIGTGRTHQIRIHSQHCGCPVLGDPDYSKDLAGQQATPRMLLHALQYQFLHPNTGKTLTARAPTPADMLPIAAELAGVKPSEFEAWLTPRIADALLPEKNRLFDDLMRKLVLFEAEQKEIQDILAEEEENDVDPDDVNYIIKKPRNYFAPPAKQLPKKAARMLAKKKERKAKAAQKRRVQGQAVR